MYAPTRHLNARPDYEFPHTEHVEALENIQERIDAAAAELASLEAQRLHLITAAVEDGMQKVRIGMHLGATARQLNQWITEAKDARRAAGERELF
jgi:hypothetical protein